MLFRSKMRSRVTSYVIQAMWEFILETDRLCMRPMRGPALSYPMRITETFWQSGEYSKVVSEETKTIEKGLSGNSSIPTIYIVIYWKSQLYIVNECHFPTAPVWMQKNLRRNSLLCRSTVPGNMGDLFVQNVLKFPGV